MGKCFFFFWLCRGVRNKKKVHLKLLGAFSVFIHLQLVSISCHRKLFEVTTETMFSFKRLQEILFMQKKKKVPNFS